MRTFDDEWIHGAEGFISATKPDGLTVECILTRIAHEIGVFLKVLGA